MAALMNLILAIAIAILLPLLQHVAPALAAAPEAALAPAASVAPDAPAAPAAPTRVWTASCADRVDVLTESRTVRVFVGDAEGRCEFRFVAQPQPAAPARLIRVTTT